jgi:RND family efflux transporter MFP subunit
MLTWLLVAGIFAATTGCGKKEHGETPKVAPQVIKGVKTQQVVEATVTDQLEATGTVKAKNSAVVAARIPGAVNSVLVKEGDRVAKGKLLLTIEAHESMAGAAAASAGVDEASRGVEEAQSRKRLADITFDRYQKLLAEQAVTRQEFDGRLAEKEVAAQGLARAQARLIQAREGARAASAVAGYTKITAPLTGIVTAKQAEVGMTVFPGTPLLTVEEEGNYRLEVAAPESVLGKIRPGQQLTAVLDGAGELAGRIAEIVPAVDPVTRTFTVKVDIAGKGLRSGSYGKAMIPVGTRKGLNIPRTAILERGALTSVWVVGGDNIARMRLVKVGGATGNQVEILAGLSAGELIVAAGAEAVVDGVKLE